MTAPTLPTGFYWWHRSLLRELAACGGTYNSRGLASNVQSLHTDTLTALGELKGWGFVEVAEPQWELANAEWFTLTPAGEAVAS